MILLILMASILIITVTIYQYDEQKKEYNIKRFGRKEFAAKESIDIELKNKTTLPITTEYLPSIFRSRIYEISAIHNLEISMYDLDGTLLKTSIASVFQDSIQTSLPQTLLTELAEKDDGRVLVAWEQSNINYETSYCYINDLSSSPMGILKLEFSQDNFDQERDLEEFLSRLTLVYFFMFVIAITMAYFLSSYITRSIKVITQQMHKTKLHHRNEKIYLENASSELNILVDAYNNMIDELEESAAKLAMSEREQAWREMAKQVAHEIKNPLTPMRLSVQSFERKFDPADPSIDEKVKEYCKTLIQQIDVMSSIASAFSDFAKMPKPKREQIDVVDVVKMAMDIFNEDYVSYNPLAEKLYGNLDKTQLIRIVTNLVKNANQAVENKENPRVVVRVFSQDESIVIEVEDNGKGIEKEVEELIFEPKFTTKSSGMGLGLPIIKNIIEAYNGTLSFRSQEGKGTIFTVTLPKS